MAANNPPAPLDAAAAADAEGRRKTKLADEQGRIDGYRVGQPHRMLDGVKWVPAPAGYSASENYYFFFPEGGVKE